MAFLSEGTVSQLATSRPVASLNESVKTASADPKSKDVFLSHSSKDTLLLPGVIVFLSEHGASTYIDRLDDSMPNLTSPETGVRLKGRINECPRFLLLVTANSQASKWVPWELGLADGIKTYPTVAILPITKTGTEESWASQEYLGIYCQVFLDTDGKYKVLDRRDNKCWKLDFWLKNPVR